MGAQLSTVFSYHQTEPLGADQILSGTSFVPRKG
jgi:hypothetical protein